MRRFQRLLLTCLAAGWIGVLGCERDSEPPIEPAPEELEPGPAARAPEAPAEEPAGPEVVTDSYQLQAQTEATYAAGDLGQMSVEITGRGQWHVNEEFPTRVELTAPPQVKLPKATLDKQDAAEFGGERVRFDIPFTPEGAGEHEVVAEVAFAICTEDTCVPQRKTLAVTLQVE